MKLGIEVTGDRVDSVSDRERRLLLERIASSQTFHRSARLREVLLDIGEKTLAGQTHELSEHLIGVRVFGRDASYNAAEDTIVRSSARQLRHKLTEYFATEGCHERLLLEIPKGAYVASFVPRQIVQEPEASAVEAPPAPAAPVDAIERGRRWRVWVAGGLAAAIIFAVGLWTGRQASVAHAAGAGEAGGREIDTLFSRLFTEHPGSIRFVVTDSVVAILGPVQAPPDLQKYIDGSYLKEAALNMPGGAAEVLVHGLENRQITSYADVAILTKLLQTHPSWANSIEVRHAKHMRAGDFKIGNFIITGSFRSNPWGGLFEASTRYPIEAGRFRNLAPGPGEPAYWPERESDSISVARISVLNNLQASGFVLNVAGTTMEATEGAGEFLLRPGSVKEILEFLRLRSNDRIVPFEMIVEIGRLQGTATSARILAAHRVV
jgi:hypothetical protein